jgi:hypothetical protein
LPSARILLNSASLAGFLVARTSLAAAPVIG